MSCANAAEIRRQRRMRKILESSGERMRKILGTDEDQGAEECSKQGDVTRGEDDILLRPVHQPETTTKAASFAPPPVASRDLPSPSTPQTLAATPPSASSSSSSSLSFPSPFILWSLMGLAFSAAAEWMPLYSLPGLYLVLWSTLFILSSARRRRDEEEEGGDRGPDYVRLGLTLCGVRSERAALVSTGGRVVVDVVTGLCTFMFAFLMSRALVADLK